MHLVPVMIDLCLEIFVVFLSNVCSTINPQDKQKVKKKSKISQRNALCVSVDGNHKEEKEVEKKMKLSHPSNIFCMIYNHNRPICLCIFCRIGMHTQIDFHLGNIVKKNLLLFPSFKCILPHCNSLVMTFLCCVNATSSKREG